MKILLIIKLSKQSMGVHNLQYNQVSQHKPVSTRVVYNRLESELMSILYNPNSCTARNQTALLKSLTVICNRQ